MQGRRDGGYLLVVAYSVVSYDGVVVVAERHHGVHPLEGVTAVWMGHHSLVAIRTAAAKVVMAVSSLVHLYISVT